MSEVPTVIKKKPWLSKTLIGNTIAAILALLGFADRFTPEQIVLTLTVINILLRLITKDKIGLDE